MKATIGEYDPTGVKLNEEEFTLPLIPSEEETPKYESRKKTRFILSIGNCKYWIYKDGTLEKLGE